MGVRPGGDIFIHGGPRRPVDRRKTDWTAGCIAVSDEAIDDLYRAVVPNARLEIRP
jgi:L,D-peptidoglycan transpeptidase YkuD (ErfK/YbiS/YcfS/YnhG family)